MKKQYIKAQTRVIMLDSENLLAASLSLDTTNQITGSQRSKRTGDQWDFEDEEEF